MTFKQIASTSDWLIIEAVFPQLTPDDLYDHFTTADLLMQWWVGDGAEVNALVGGTYHFEWTAMDWHLRGTYKAAERGKVLAFSWKWDHERTLPAREVCVVIQPDEAGSKLTLLHGIYSESDADQQDRQSHLDGWQHFLGQLGALGV